MAGGDGAERLGGRACSGRGQGPQHPQAPRQVAVSCPLPACDCGTLFILHCLIPGLETLTLLLRQKAHCGFPNSHRIQVRPMLPESLLVAQRTRPRKVCVLHPTPPPTPQLAVATEGRKLSGGVGTLGP